MSAQLSLESYWNTTNLRGPDLASAHAIARRQDDAVLAIIRQRGRAMTPSEVWRIGCDRGESWLLTSVRRSMTNLTPSKLTKTDDKRRGPYGRSEYVWSLA